MKIKKHLVAAALAVGLAGSAGSATATSHGTSLTPNAQIGFVIAWKVTRNVDDDFLKGAATAYLTGAGGAAGGLAMVWAGAKIGGSLGAVFGGPVGVIGGAATGAF